MFGKHHDLDNSYQDESSASTRKIAALESDLETAREDAETSKKLSLRPLVLKYELELRELRAKLNLSLPVPGELCKKNVQLWDDEISTLTTFIKELLDGAHEVL